MALAAPAAAQDRAAASERVVTTTGQSEIAMAPDQAWVTVGIEARAVKSQDAQKRAAEVMTGIQTQLAALGIPVAAIRTVAFNLQADWNYASGRRTLRGYLVSNIIEVRVDDIAKVPDVLDRSISAGGNTIHGVRWDIKDRVRVERDALRRAVEDAKQRAEIAASAAGGRLGPVTMISEQRYEVRQKMNTRMANAGGEALEVQAATPISAGEIDVRATVTVSFRIE
ncbi:MAG: SIMPL domain-containing protein [Acidobacteriota bacterium]|nr:SIMPL domain-containing protein [Acidobacteriota bacterium]